MALLKWFSYDNSSFHVLFIFLLKCFQHLKTTLVTQVWRCTPIFPAAQEVGKEEPWAQQFKASLGNTSAAPLQTLMLTESASPTSDYK
jgi:hypothetical protein